MAAAFNVGDKVVLAYGRKTTKAGVINWVAPKGGRWDYSVKLADGSIEMAKAAEVSAA
jgi:hypothetical protein